MKAKPYVVLVGMDFSELADRALQEAFELTSSRELAEVHVLCVIPGPTLSSHSPLTGYSLTAEECVRDGAFESLRAHVQLELDWFVEHAEPGTRVPERVVSHVRIDVPALGIARLASEVSADVVVLGTHGQRRTSRQLMGSVAENTLRFAGCPVLVIPQPEEPIQRANEAPWPSASISSAPRSANHHPSVRP